VAAAEAAMTAVQTAISSVADQAANVGATQNQITSLSSNLMTAQQNIESAHANLVDVNVAQETSVFASDQILEQSGVSVLAQAEQLPSLAEKLLQ
jgi:flagellin